MVRVSKFGDIVGFLRRAVAWWTREGGALGRCAVLGCQWDHRPRRERWWSVVPTALAAEMERA